MMERAVALKPSDSRLSREIGRKLSPLSSSRILGDYWYLQLTGKQAEAADLLKKSAAQGVPLPVDEK